MRVNAGHRLNLRGLRVPRLERLAKSSAGLMPETGVEVVEPVVDFLREHERATSKHDDPPMVLQHMEKDVEPV